MASRYQNITIDQGADFVMNVVAYRSQSETSASLVLTTGGGAQPNFYSNAHLRKSHYHANATLEFSTSIISDGDGSADPVIEFSLHRNNTAILTPGRYVYDVELTSPTTHGENPDADDDKRWRILEGIATVTPEATK